jgi:hypothetical protein
MFTLPKVNFKTIKKDKKSGVFEFSPLIKGFGNSLGAALRRTLFAASEGAVITKVRFEGVSHQFTTIEGAKDDVLHMLLALKKVRFSKTDEKDGRVVGELEYDVKNKNWKLIKIREDRRDEPNYYGNHLFKVAEQSWMATKYPFTLEQMANPLTNYFGLGKDKMYKAQTGFNSFVKSKLLSLAKTLIPSKVAIDLASGKGQDLGRYYDNGFTKTIFCDYDPIALSELVTRRFDMIKDKNRKNTMAIQTLHRDLNLPADDTIQIFKSLLTENNVGLIVCNFAIHYLITDIDKLNNFIKLVRNLSSKGTIFYFTTMSGQSVVDLIGTANDWKAHENGVLKYQIVKKYSGNKLTDMGQTINTKMPFSDELFTENLVNIELVNAQFIKFGFRLLASEGFKIFLNQFKAENPNVYALLTEDDKKFVSLYHYSMFQI